MKCTCDYHGRQFASSQEDHKHKYSKKAFVQQQLTEWIATHEDHKTQNNTNVRAPSTTG